MTLFDFGQPENGYCQLGFIVQDIHEAMLSFTRNLRAGPWFLMERIRIMNVLYRGSNTQINASLSYANSGHVQIELIQQHDDVPSIFTELTGTRGFGLHHQGIAVRDFDAELRRFQAMGHEIMAYAENDVHSRAAFLDPKGRFPTLIEIMETNATVEAMFSAIYHASVGWRGDNPVRRISCYSDIFKLAGPTPFADSHGDPVTRPQTD